MAHALRLYDTIEALDILDELIAEHGDLIEAKGGEIEAIPEIAELLAFAEEDFENAVERFGLKIRTMLAEEQGAKFEADRLAAVVRQKGNGAKRMKEYLLRQLEARGVKKVQRPLVRVRVQANSQLSVRALSETVIEELWSTGSPFISQKVEYVLNRDEILRAYEAGELLPDGIEVKKGNHLRVE